MKAMSEESAWEHLLDIFAVRAQTSDYVPGDEVAYSRYCRAHSIFFSSVVLVDFLKYVARWCFAGTDAISFSNLSYPVLCYTANPMHCSTLPFESSFKNALAPLPPSPTSENHLFSHRLFELIQGVKRMQRAWTLAALLRNPR